MRGSPQGLAMLRVPAGTSRVELRYVGPWQVRVAFWLSGAAWVAPLLTGIYRLLAGFFRLPSLLTPTPVTAAT
ncbi:MAG: hypothetical protein H7343_01525 [Undibacterium sp.]|nr:hypothetical protein [Opitutaceae bacterium]